jgi:hypothetical protein
MSDLLLASWELNVRSGRIHETLTTVRSAKEAATANKDHGVAIGEFWF